MRRNCNGIYSVLEQIRKRLSEETTYTEGVSEVPEGEDPSFEANQVASGYSLPWDSGDRKNPGLGVYAQNICPGRSTEKSPHLYTSI